MPKHVDVSENGRLCFLLSDSRQVRDYKTMPSAAPSPALTLPLLAMSPTNRPACIAALPDDVLLLIISYIDVSDILALRKVRIVSATVDP